MNIPVAQGILRSGQWLKADSRVVLSYDARFLRRKRLVAEDGGAFLVDLAETTSLDQGDAFQLSDGRLIVVIAAAEEIIEVRGDLPRLAWHIGNRHTPCQIGATHLAIRRDHVLEKMLTGLGAELTPSTAPFRPEGGAYGHGRTMGHDHGGHDHGHFGHHHGDGKFHVHG
ncbi:urease accessory protein [Gemmobacter caeni]|uniref:Urease accessory protein UreE n=1 Tax=Gemmobacter caeni TaxID=589035 RepID=A0A2T6B6M7_9RHOB|nr:urease accessory protein UreE [Gemmobacter caeni]PTX51720.1 urease accessory protein [Gemmobacter caeni]TWJ03848.1 urease accessory protein [Gemmobacter caeni]